MSDVEIEATEAAMRWLVDGHDIPESRFHNWDPELVQHYMDITYPGKWSQWCDDFLNQVAPNFFFV